MPTTKRKARKQPAAARRSTNASISHSSPPDRSTKRRRVRRSGPVATARLTQSQTNGPSTYPAVRPATPEEEGEGEGGDGNESVGALSTAEAQEVADRIIPLLDVAPYPITVASEHANDRYDGETAGAIQAYAKICGAHWTYYINTTSINIGRTPEPGTRNSSGIRAESSPGDGGDEPKVHIDLGPHKHVSRHHATLFFDSSDVKWHIRIEGRNGLRVNNMMLKRGQQRAIECGDILEIANTQMMFVTANEKAIIDDSFLRKLQEETSEDEQVDEAYQQPASAAHATKSSIPYPDARQHVNRLPTNSAVAPSFVRPTTPVQSARKMGGAPNRSPATGDRTSTAAIEEIDYSLDAYKEWKPTCSYSVMIGRAILSTRDEAMTLNGIYKWISNNFAYYRYNKTNWKNSIRHNLSIHEQFQKIPRRSDEPGKGMKWCIPANQRAKVIAEINRQQSKGSKYRSKSTPSPPTMRAQDLSANAPSLPQLNGAMNMSPVPRSPPLSAYPPTAQESFTPSRGSRVTAFSNHESETHGLPNLSSDDPAMLPVRRSHGPVAASLASSPTLTSGAWLGYDGSSMRTPAPRAYNLNIPLPNTMAKPSSYMPDSSPAPFWKFTQTAAGSTPGLWPVESSPLKPPALPSSSPPPPATNGVGADSPTKARGTMSFGASGVDAEDDEGGIDLAKGFQNISSFHKRRAEAAAANMVS